MTGDLFEEPKTNSPEDLGFGSNARGEKPRPEDADKGPPEQKRYGESTPGPDPIPHNVASGTIQYADAQKFVEWLHAQDLPCHADVTVGHVLVGLSGFTPKDLAWLCQNCRIVGRVPDPYQMAKAVRKHDPAFLFED